MQAKMQLSKLSEFLRANNKRIPSAVGEFIINDQLGQGANGVVYGCELNLGFSNKTNLAIKVLLNATDKSKYQRFIADYINIMSIKSKYIVNYYYCNEFNIQEDKFYYIVMDKHNSTLAGKTCSNTDDFKKLFDFLINSIGQIHQNGIIHRDIKPENILIDNNNDNGFVLCDFGIAYFDTELGVVKHKTRKGERISNRGFSAPEQLNADVNPDQTMDIYALGQVLYYYIYNETIHGSLHKKISEKFPDLSVYDSIINKCIAQNPTDRFQSVDEINEYIITVREPQYNFWPLLHKFDELIRNIAPKMMQNQIYKTVEQTRINKMIDGLISIINYDIEYSSNIWFLEGSGNCHISIMKKLPCGRVYIDHDSYLFDEMYLLSANNEANSFIVIHYAKDEPFIYDDKQTYVGHWFNEHMISYNEYVNRFAEINGEVIQLDHDNCFQINRQDKSGYMFFVTAYSSTQRRESDQFLIKFNELSHSTDANIIDLLGEFHENTRRFHHHKVAMQL